MNSIKIVIADDQILFSESLKTVLETRGDSIEVVAVACNGKEAIRKVEIFKPNIVLMDIRMPEMDGVEATRIIRSEFPQTKILILTTFDDDEYISKALKCGATGYLLKNTPPNELLAAIYNAQNGMVMISPSVAAHLANAIELNIPVKKPDWISRLSKREREVLKFISMDLENREIAEKLFIAEQTVKNHISLIYSKLETHSRRETALLGRKHINYL
ncbi:MAG: response regulator transcription factor [Spirochaetales bacterium]|nr:response regulator transcription factor [Spirochaetales bacterium]